MRFFLIDKIRNWQVGKSAEAIKNISLSEDFFDDHYPRHPVMPGVLIIEGIAQLSGLLLETTAKEKFGGNPKAIMAVLERTKFRGLVRPGDTLVYHTELTSITKDGGKVKAEATYEGRVIVTTGMTFAFRDIDDYTLDSKRKALMKIWMSE